MVALEIASNMALAFRPPPPARDSLEELAAKLLEYAREIEDQLLREERSWELANMPYNEYLQTCQWDEKRTAARARAGERCQVCNSPGPLNVHHRTYERRGAERDEDLMVLC